jgi:hypothetical protein
VSEVDLDRKNWIMFGAEWRYGGYGQFHLAVWIIIAVAVAAGTRRGLRQDETTMEDRSSRRMRTLVTRMARLRPVG